MRRAWWSTARGRSWILWLAFAAGVSLVLLGVAFVFSAALYEPSGGPTDRVHSPGQLQSLSKSNVRFRSSCNVPLIEWTEESSFWLPPHCHYATIYAGMGPFINVTEAALGPNSIHIHVAGKTQIGSLENQVGSDFIAEHWPFILVIDKHKRGTKYLYLPDGDATDNEFGNWVKQLTPDKEFWKSEKLDSIPSAVEEANVPVDINASFYKELLDSPAPQRFFVTFHAPWCGHCRVFLSKFEPLVKALARKNSRRNLAFYKFDVTANDQPLSPALKLRVNQVPTTIFFYPTTGGALTSVELKDRKNPREGLLQLLRLHNLYEEQFGEL